MKNRHGKHITWIILDLFFTILMLSVPPVHSADQANETLTPKPFALLKAVAEARTQITSGKINYTVSRYYQKSPADGTNSIQLEIVFSGQQRRAEQLGREFCCIFMGSHGGEVIEAKMRELGLDQEAAAKAGLLTGYESRYVTAYDGSLILRYGSVNRNTTIDDAKKGSYTYAFDPRVLGITTFPFIRDTPESCLPYDRGGTVKMIGKEIVESIPAWHVAIVLTGGKIDYWLDVNHPTHVIKYTSNGDTMFSKYDDANPSDPLPVEAHAVQLHGLERAVSETWYQRTSALYNIPVDPTAWTFAGLKMPVGTLIMDARLSRDIGYWSGTEVSQKFIPSRERNVLDPLAPAETALKLLALADKDPRSPFALEAAIWTILNTPGSASSDKAIALIQRDHLRSPYLLQLCQRLEELKLPHKRDLLETVLNSNPDAKVQAYATYALAILTKTQANETGNIQLAATALKMFQRIVDDFSQVDVFGEEKIAGRAKQQLTEMQMLSIGTSAPEIAGDDLDGHKMTLSEYRGKVVVLCFWGTWCGSCMQAVPNERKLVEQMAGKPFAFIGVNSDTDETKLKTALKKERITWPSFRDGQAGTIANAWSIQSWPAVFVIDRQGILRYRDVEGKALFDAVEKLLLETK